MNHEKDGTKVLFFDTYALYSIALGNDSYKEYRQGFKLITTLMNLYELYYRLVQDNFLMEAEIFFEKFLPDCVEIKPSIIKEAAIFRLQNKKLELSYVDALGYITAKKHDALFLTGDNAFKKLQNVEFVK